MELRWLVHVDRYSRYDSRDDENYVSSYKRDPILQYRTEDSEWVDAPTVEIPRDN